MPSLASLLSDLFAASAASPQRAASLSGPQGAPVEQSPVQPAIRSGIPTKQEAFSYLAQLADEYHLPRKLVYAVADAESSFDVQLQSANYARDRRHGLVHDRLGKPVVRSWDYGLMQINSQNIGKQVVQDPNGKRFTIGENVRNDWKANALAGVAMLAPAYELAVLEQGPSATEEDHAQQAYSQYNGSPRMRDRYLKERRGGLSQNDADRNFLQKYRRWQEGKH